MRVALLTTGQTERNGLPAALGGLFPGHEFMAIDDIPNRPFKSFTSTRLPLPPGRVPTATALDKLIATAASLVDPDTESPVDMVIIFDDLELANRTQPAVVADTVRSAAMAHLHRYTSQPARQARLATALQQCVSFHLAVPMIEAWFFGAAAALTALGLSGSTPFHIRPGDPEEFESTDIAFIGANDSLCTEWCRRRRRRGDRPKWIGAGADRIYHPKGYLQWLLIDPADKTCTCYEENATGSAALAQIQWASLLNTRPQPAMGFARSLVEDLEDRLGVTPSVALGTGSASKITSVHALPADPVLRNL